MTEFSQKQWEEWKGRRSLFEENAKARGFEVKGWINGKPIVPGVFERDLTAWALSTNEKRAKYSVPPAPVVEPEPTSEIEEAPKEKAQQPAPKRRGRRRKKQP